MLLAVRFFASDKTELFKCTDAYLKAVVFILLKKMANITLRLFRVLIQTYFVRTEIIRSKYYL